MNVIAIPKEHAILQWFKHKRIFVEKNEIAYSPAELIGSSYIRPKPGLLVNLNFFQAWPSAILIRHAKIGTFCDLNTTDRPFHLWIGDNLIQEDLFYGDRAPEKALERILHTWINIHIRSMDFFGYACLKHDCNQNAFGILYTVKVGRAQLIKNKWYQLCWMTIADLKQNYRKLDPWSKRIFDYIYETPVIRKELDLYEKCIQK